MRSEGFAVRPDRVPGFPDEALHLNKKEQGKGAVIMDMKLEVLVIPVSDVDRAKTFYEKLGFRLNIEAEKFR